MGDRGNIAIEYVDNKRVYFYTHDRGSDLPAVLQDSLKRVIEAGREDDDYYLARMVFCDLVQGSERDSTGFGIGPYMGDNKPDRRIFVVDTVEKRVYLETEEGMGFGLESTWTFNEFVKLDLNYTFNDY